MPAVSMQRSWGERFRRRFTRVVKSMAQLGGSTDPAPGPRNESGQISWRPSFGLRAYMSEPEDLTIIPTTSPTTASRRGVCLQLFRRVRHRARLVRHSGAACAPLVRRLRAAPALFRCRPSAAWALLGHRSGCKPERAGCVAHSPRAPHPQQKLASRRTRLHQGQDGEPRARSTRPQSWANPPSDLPQTQSRPQPQLVDTAHTRPA